MMKLIACDLDGTLLDGNHGLSDKSKAVLPKLAEQGIQFMVATGRMAQSVIPMFEHVLPDCEYLLLNGALITDAKGKALYEVTMKKEHIRLVDAIFQKYDICYHMFTGIGTITSDEKRCVKAFLEHLQQQGLDEGIAMKMKDESGFCRYAREVKDISAFLSEEIPVYKMEAFGGLSQNLEKARSELQACQALHVTNSIEDNIEVTQKTAQKGIALATFCKEKGIAKEDVLVIGDSLNDLSMIEEFPNSIAMKNGHSYIQKAAAYISRYTNEEDGVADILEQLLETLSIQEK